MSGIRPEARALSLGDLDHYQMEAVEKVSRSLWSALEDLSRAHKAGGAGSSGVDPFRASRLFFISGEPGGGKTTVYLSLREALRSGTQEIPVGLKNFRTLVPCSRRLFWLEPLDLEPASGATNFLAAVLVRIEEAIGISDRAGDIRKPGLLEAGTRRSEGMQNLRRLQSDVVLSWDGNVAQRAEHLDGEAYAMEVLHVERAKLKVNARLQEAIEGIVPEEKKGEEVLFILPVDDFYLKPDASLSLLRLLRMISIPRLFILILGDLDVVEELFYQELLGQLVGLAGSQVFHDVERQSRVLTSRASALSAHALRKLVPLAQRSRLQIMFELRALDFAPAQLDKLQLRSGEEADSEMRRTLGDLLALIPIQLPFAALLSLGEKRWSPKNLKEFLCLRDRKYEIESDDYTYSGLAILDLPPREVVDLWYSLYSAISNATNGGDGISLDGVIEIVIQQTLEALAAQTYLSVEEQKWCEDSIQGSPNYKRLLAPQALKVASQLDQNVKLVVSSRGEEYEIFGHQAWKFRPSKTEAVSESLDIGLAPRPSAWLILLHDLMALAGEDRLLGEPLPPRTEELGWVRVKRKGTVSSWPLPAWPSFWHLDRFRFAWSKAVRVALAMMKKEKRIAPDLLISWLAFHWARFATDVLLSNRNELKTEPRDIEKLGPAWEELKKNVTVLRNIVLNESDIERKELALGWSKDLDYLVKEYDRRGTRSQKRETASQAPAKSRKIPKP